MAEYIFNDSGTENEENGSTDAIDPASAAGDSSSAANNSTPKTGEYVYNEVNTPPSQTPPSYTPPTYTPPPYNPPTPPKPKKSGGKLALIVVSIIMATLLVAGAAGIGGYLIARNAVGDYSGPIESDRNDDKDNDDKDAGKDNNNNEDNTHQSAGVVIAPESAGTKDKGTIAEVVAAVADSVVEITTEYATVDSFYYTQGAGSGVIIHENGYIITNNHVINDDSYGIADIITVRLSSGDEYTATVVGTDTDTDIAVLKIEADGLPAAVIGQSSTLAVGEEVIVIGNPLGTLGGTVTNGIISALDREITVDNETMNLLQTNAAVNPGNSGGGMFNLAGELVGVVNAKYSESGIEGLGFAIPMDDAAYVANEILEYGYVKGRVSLHISIIDIDTYQEAMQYRVNALGLYVYEAEKGFNDDVLQSGDRIAQVGDVEITCAADLKAVLKTCKVGDTLEAVIVRNGRYSTVTLTCYERTATSQNDVDFEK